jgi:adenylate cyclase
MIRKLTLGLRHLAMWTTVGITSALAGALYATAWGQSESAIGAIYGLSTGLLAVLVERARCLRSLRERIRRLPTFFYFLAAETLLLSTITVGFMVGGAIVWRFGLADGGLSAIVQPQPTAILYSFFVSSIFVFILRIRDLIGSRTFSDLILGRYHRPIVENRIFLLMDLVGSTSFAERHGDIAAQQLLSAVFAAISEPILQHNGQIDDYIGDLVMVSWPMNEGLERARCVACLFAVKRELTRNRERWLNRFGIVPEFRAALHGGQVVTAEIGVDRHKISYFGDAINVASRLEGLCRETGHPALISQSLLSHLGYLPDKIVARSLGLHTLRGKLDKMNVFTLEINE